ncbi:hypothetical protein Tco_0257507 [Tanacetum coccineum]
MEQPITCYARSTLPGQVLPLDVLNTHTAWVKASKEIVDLMLMTMDLYIQKNLEQLGAYDILKELKTLYAQQVQLKKELSCISCRVDEKKKKLSQGASTSGIFTIELYSFPSTSWVYDTGCGTHICITTQGLRGSRKLKPGALSLYVGDGHTAAFEAMENIPCVSLWSRRTGSGDRERGGDESILDTGMTICGMSVQN